MTLRKRNRIIAFKITPWRDPVLTVSTGPIVLEMDETANVLDEMREYIECDYIEHLRIDINGTPFDLWFDEDDNPKEPDWQKVLAVPGAKLHLYGKAQARHARKMGHITCVGKTLEEALQRAQMVARILGLPEPK